MPAYGDLPCLLIWDIQYGAPDPTRFWCWCVCGGASSAESSSIVSACGPTKRSESLTFRSSSDNAKSPTDPKLTPSKAPAYVMKVSRRVATVIALRNRLDLAIVGVFRQDKERQMLGYRRKSAREEDCSCVVVIITLGNASSSHVCSPGLIWNVSRQPIFDQSI